MNSQYFMSLKLCTYSQEYFFWCPEAHRNASEMNMDTHHGYLGSQWIKLIFIILNTLLGASKFFRTNLL